MGTDRGPLHGENPVPGTPWVFPALPCETLPPAPLRWPGGVPSGSDSQRATRGIPLVPRGVSACAAWGIPLGIGAGAPP